MHAQDDKRPGGEHLHPLVVKLMESQSGREALNRAAHVLGVCQAVVGYGPSSVSLVHDDERGERIEIEYSFRSANEDLQGRQSFGFRIEGDGEVSSWCNLGGVVLPEDGSWILERTEPVAARLQEMFCRLVSYPPDSVREQEALGLGSPLYFDMIREGVDILNACIRDRPAVSPQD
jgi:hypothetical protein